MAAEGAIDIGEPGRGQAQLSGGCQFWVTGEIGCGVRKRAVLGRDFPEVVLDEDGLVSLSRRDFGCGLLLSPY